jgi:hypothetical protein
MKQELRRVAPFRAANVTAVVYGILMGVMALVFMPFFLIAMIFQPSASTSPAAAAGPIIAVLMLVLYPVMGVVMGWILGLAGAAIYNYIIRWTGGLLVEFQDAPSAASPAS